MWVTLDDFDHHMNPSCGSLRPHPTLVPGLAFYDCICSRLFCKWSGTVCDPLGLAACPLRHSPETRPGCVWVCSSLCCWLVVHTLWPLEDPGPVSCLPNSQDWVLCLGKQRGCHAWHPAPPVSGLANADLRFVLLHPLQRSGAIPSPVVSMTPPVSL